jgi:hypothetical protein
MLGINSYAEYYHLVYGTRAVTPQDLDRDDRALLETGCRSKCDDVVQQHPIEVSVQQKRPEDISKPALIAGVLIYLVY